MKNSTKCVIACSAILLLSGCVISKPEPVTPVAVSLAKSASNNTQHSPTESNPSNSSNTTSPTSKATSSDQPVTKPQSQAQRIQDEIKTLTTMITNKKSVNGTIQVGVTKTYHYTLSFNGYYQSGQAFTGTISTKEDKATNHLAGNFDETTLHLNESVNLPSQDTPYTREIILNPDGNGQFESNWNYDDYYQDNIKVTLSLDNQ